MRENCMKVLKQKLYGGIKFLTTIRRQSASVRMKCLLLLLAIVINEAWCLLPGEDNFVKSSVTSVDVKSKDGKKANGSTEGTAEGKDGRREKKARTFIGPLSLDFGDKFSIESSSCCSSKYGSYGNGNYPSRYGSRPSNRYDWQSSSYPLGLTGSSESIGRPGGNTYNEDRYGSRPGYGDFGRPGRPSFSIGGGGGYGGGSPGGGASEFGGGFQAGRPGSFSGGSGSFGEGGGGYGNGGYGGGGYGGGYDGGGSGGRPSYGGRPGFGGGGSSYGGGGSSFGGGGSSFGGGGSSFGGGGSSFGGGGSSFGGGGSSFGGGGPGYGISGTFGDHGTFGGHGGIGGYPDDNSSSGNIQTQKALALKALAGVALIGAAAALASNPVLLPLGAVSGRRKRSDNYYDRDQSYMTATHANYANRDEITQDDIILKSLLTSPKCIARLACEIQRDYVTDIKKYKDTAKKDESVYRNLEDHFMDLIRVNILDSKYVRKRLKEEITRAVSVGASKGSCKVFPCELTTA